MLTSLRDTVRRFFHRRPAGPPRHVAPLSLAEIRLHIAGLDDDEICDLPIHRIDRRPRWITEHDRQRWRR
jgi:hypothetical protein